MKKRNFLFIPVFLTMSILPLLVYPKVYDSRLTGFSWTPDPSKDIDLFLYYKQIVFLILSGICVCFGVFLLYQMFHTKNEQFQQNPITRKQWAMWIPLGIYLFFAIVSSICSEYRYIAFTGNDEQFESVFALTGYCLFAFYCFLFFCTHKTFRLLLLTAGGSMTLLSLLGLLQFWGIDPLQWEWMQKLTGLSDYVGASDKLSTWTDLGRVHLFSYNPNYAGVLLTLWLAFLAGLLITETKRNCAVAELVLLGALLLCLIGTGSKAGILTFGAVCAFSLLFARKRLMKRWYLVIPTAGAVLGCIFLILAYNKVNLVDYIGQALKFEKSEENPIQRMVTTPDGIELTYRGVSFTVSFDYNEGGFSAAVWEHTNGASDAEIPLLKSENGEKYTLGRKEFQNVTLQFGKLHDIIPLISISLDGRDWMFIRLDGEENRYFYLNHLLKAEQLEDIERFGFEGYEHFATERGLLWSMTLPLLKKYPVFGSGANTFVFACPQNNYKDLYYYTGAPTINTRPHSMYLQTAVESGVVSLFALLVFFGWYLIQSLKIYWCCEFSSLEQRVGFACFLAVTVYLICGLTNDSMITVAPVFWGILGIGMAVNRSINLPCTKCKIPS